MNKKQKCLYQTEAFSVAKILSEVDTDYRGVFYNEVADCLDKHFTQYFTAKLFREMAKRYGVKES